MPWDTRLQTPFNMLISGPNGSGKTSLVKNLLTMSDDMFTKKPSKVFLFYKMMQNIYTEMKDQNLVHELINVNQGMPDLNEIRDMVEPYKDGNGSLMIFDDIMTHLSKDFENIFCNLSHHMNCSVIFLTQNMFYRDPAFRTMSLNSHYIIAMNNPRDKQQISLLAKQFNPGNTNFIVEAFKKATHRPYGYLFFDYKPQTDKILRVRSNIFPHEHPYTIYLEKSDENRYKFN